MTLLPPKVDPTCEHSVAVFGCDSCLLKERRDTLEEAKRTTPIPKCPECGGKMVLYDSDVRTMMIFFGNYPLTT